MGKTGSPVFGAWLRGRIGPRSYGHLATYLGVSTSTVSRWVTGESAPEYRNRLRLAEYLDASIEEIDEFFAPTIGAEPHHPQSYTAPAVRDTVVPGGAAGSAGPEAALLAEVALPLLTGTMTREERQFLIDFARRVNARLAAAGGRRDDPGRGGPSGVGDPG